MPEEGRVSYQQQYVQFHSVGAPVPEEGRVSFQQFV